MIFKDYYKILGMETNKVNTEDIKSAYREQAKKYHPDVNIGDKSAEERFKDINEAYKILLNPTTKKKYDRAWNSRIGKKKNAAKQTQTRKAGPVTRGDIFSMFFGETSTSEKQNNVENVKEKKVPTQGENVETEIPISIIEGFFGATKKISLRAVNGKMRTFEVNIPSGIRNGEKIRLIGQGKQGENGGKNGDLLIRIDIKEDKKYKLVGSDIFTDLKISPCEAVLGTKINIDAIDETIGVYVPQGIETDEEIKIENKGYKDNKTGRGNFVIRVKIVIPKNISEKEKELYKQIKKVSKFNAREI